MVFGTFFPKDEDGASFEIFYAILSQSNGVCGENH